MVAVESVSKKDWLAWKSEVRKFIYLRRYLEKILIAIIIEFWGGQIAKKKPPVKASFT